MVTGIQKDVTIQNQAMGDPDSPEMPLSREKANPAKQAWNPYRSNLKHQTTPDKAQTCDPLSEFDEYGTELHKDARVWKVYVNEADKHDMELVNGWNDSTDVILIFAALFSAISTAFLIESSKLLQSDPADVTALRLLTISQTLSSIANGTEPPEPASQPASDPSEFIPSRADVIVNILWYLSLSLSLATAFIAILAKDWCHSFMTGRTGHPYSQTCRRQQKWNMIEKWKMAELLTLLPSLIHAALLLFSVGLCFHLWSKNTLVALPVVCISGIALSFYVGSSLAAIVFDFFPYPTIISRLCRTEIVRRISQSGFQSISLVALVASRVVKEIVFPDLYLLILSLSYIAVFAAMVLIALPALVAYVIRKVEAPLNRWCAYLSTRSRPLQLFAALFHATVRLLVWYPAEKIFDRLSVVVNYLISLTDSIENHFPAFQWRFKPVPPNTRTEVKQSGNHPKQDLVTSLALGWLIKNCENPQSVDIALQSISGAGKQFPRQPLEDCNATLEILRRLASSNLYRAATAPISVALYSRALSVLGLSATMDHTDSQASDQSSIRESLESMVWDLQALTEKSVAALITDGKFHSSTHNLEALRIGSTFASHGLQILRNSPGSVSPLFNSIIEMLNQHLDNQFALHQSALLLLVNAAASLGFFLTDCAAAASLRDHSLHVQSYNLPIRIFLTHAVILTRGEHNMRILIEWQSANPEDLDMLCEVALVELIHRFGLIAEGASGGIGQQPDNITTYNRVQIDRLWISDPWGSTLQYEVDYNSMNEDAALLYLEAFRRLYSSIQPMMAQPYVYVFVLECMHIFRSSHLQALCGRLLHILPIPEPSTEFVRLLGQRGIAWYLGQQTESEDAVQKFFAASQLWLLFVIERTLPADHSRDSTSAGLLHHLTGGSRVSSEEIEEKEGRLVELTINTWEQSNQKITDTLGVYAYQLMECLLQSYNCPIPQQIHFGLGAVPLESRGLLAIMGRNQPLGEEINNKRLTSLEQLSETQSMHGDYRAYLRRYETRSAGDEEDTFEDYPLIEKDKEPTSHGEEYQSVDESQLVAGTSCGKSMSSGGKGVGLEEEDGMPNRAHTLTNGQKITLGDEKTSEAEQRELNDGEAVVNKNTDMMHGDHVSIEMSKLSRG